MHWQYMEIERYIELPRKETLSANIAAQLKSLILKKKFKTGDRLPAERKLAEMFHVSRAVIKQALMALEHSGFIETRLGAKGGSYVKYDFTRPITVFMEDLQRNGELTIAHFDQVRRAIECAGLASAIDKATDDDIARLESLNAEFARPENRKRHAELNLAFHLALADISGNPLIQNLLRSILELVFLYPGSKVSKEFIRTAVNDHAEIIEAIRRRDVVRAETILLRNISRVQVL